MPSGKLDLFIANVPSNTLVITLKHSGSGSELHSLPRNASLVLQRGNIKKTVQVEVTEGWECCAEYMEMNLSLARRFRMLASRRYKLSYNPDAKTLTLQPSPVTVSSGQLFTLNDRGANTISVGYELLSELGIPHRQGFRLKVRCGVSVFNFRLHVPSNLSDNRLRLSPIWLQRWRLNPTHLIRVQYDQRVSLLNLSRLG